MLFNNQNSVCSLLFALIALGATACSTVLPYESEFACKNDDYGQCIHPQEAYAQAVGARPKTSDDAKAHKRDERNIDDGHILAAQGGYDGYSQAQYDELASLIEAPMTPMVAPAKTIRTLILPYADDRSETRLYMPRFVYSVLEQPKFVLGDYLQSSRPDFAGALARGMMRRTDGAAPGNVNDASKDRGAE